MTNEYKTIQYRDKVVFAKAVMGDFRRIQKYFAADEACFMVLTRGFFQLRTPDKILEFREGEALLAKCGNYLIERPAFPASSSEPVLEVVAAYFHPSIVKDFFPGDLSFSNFKPDFDASKLPMNELLKIFMVGIDFLLENPSVCNDDLIVLKIKELLLLLAKSENAPSIHQFIASLFKPYEYDFREIIHKNTLSNLTLSELALLCNMSLATFKRRFSEIFNQSPAQYFVIEKLKKAAQLLSFPELQISDIVYDCGFETVSHFNKSFKKHFGMSPTAFRLSQKGNSLT